MEHLLHYDKKSTVMVRIMGIQSGVTHLLRRGVFGKFYNHCGNHFKVSKFFCAYIGQQPDDLIGNAVPLIQVTQSRRKLSIGSAVLFNQKFSESRITGADSNRVLKFFS